MAMMDAYDNEVANYGASLMTEVGLFDDEGNEISGGNYSRQVVNWTEAGSTSDTGVIRPVEDIVFSVPAGNTVAGIRFYGSDNTVYGEGSVTNETYSNDGEFRIIADQTGILHNV